jgi:hypothetical protein
LGLGWDAQDAKAATATAARIFREKCFFMEEAIICISIVKPRPECKESLKIRVAFGW